MYKEVFKIGKEIFSFFKGDELLYINKKNDLDSSNLVGSYDLKSFVKKESPEMYPVFKFIPVKEKIWATMYRGGSIIFDDKLDNNRKVDFLLKTYDQKTSLATGLHFRKEGRKYCLFDTESLEVLWNADRARLDYFDNDKVVCILGQAGREVVRALAIDSGKKLWQFEIENLNFKIETESYPGQKDNPLKVVKIIGVNKNRLYIAFNHSLIIELNIETGSLLRQWNKLPEKVKWRKIWSDGLPLVARSYLDKKESKIIGMYGSIYWEINLSSGLVNYTNMTMVFDIQELRTDGGLDICHQGDHIFFCSDFTRKEDTGQIGSARFVYTDVFKLAAFNRKTKTIDWTYPINQRRVGGGGPVVHGNYLKVKLFGNVVHVFEKEN